MKTKELTTKSAAELTALLEEVQQKLAQLRFDLADKKLKRTSDVGAARRDVARIKTALARAK
jgi:ribosomal protein L29